MTIICTIHQPRSQIWDMFDRFALLSEGKMIYFGAAKEAVGYFGNMGYPCPPLHNPADFFLDVIAIDYHSRESEIATKRRLEQFAYEYDHNRKQDVLKESREFSQEELAHTEKEMNALIKEKQKTATRWRQFYSVFRRAFNERIRDKQVTLFRFLSQVILGLIVAFMFFNLDMTQADVQSKSGVLFFVVVQQGFSVTLQVINTFPKERTIFLRENLAGYYTTTTYYLGRTFGDLPITFTLPIAFACVMYWIVGLQRTMINFLVFNMALILTALAADGVGLLIGAISPDIAIANIITPIILILFVLVGGLYSNTGTIPPELSWIQYISFVYYAYNILMLNEFSGQVYKCPAPPASCPAPTGDIQLQNLNIFGKKIGVQVIYLVILIVGYRVIAYFALFLFKPRRKQPPG
jgi:ABC-type multidrug transport system permease subunit